MLKGWLGELKTKVAEKLLLDSKVYHVFNNVLVSARGRTTQIDHVIVSRYGVFVLETKDKTGWIFGSANQREWTQVIFNDKYRFQNPLRQNYLHIKTLSEGLVIDHSKIYSVVVFWGHCELRTVMPDNVVQGVLAPTKYIKSRSEVLFSDDEVRSICDNLSDIQAKTTSSERKDHTRELKGRYDTNKLCPRCGGRLIVRTAKTGSQAGQEFLGCGDFPRCRYKWDLGRHGGTVDD
jgi:restriction system protein